MERKKELKQLYKETKVEAGVYKITNKENGRIFIGSTPNLKTLNGVKFTLNNGTSFHKALQEDWSRMGSDSFQIEVAEVLKQPEQGYFDSKKELEKLEQKWLDELMPFGENGYN
ncbi:GIY-YIG nuclease family protein [Cytobacillus gottheilii]|uniref:GIY-YIG nuclease family protein n=1 Tax=Cytobacillus gottheilii TaxID=859144 RepID=UPI0009BAF8FB|nr:GIY-YIG nuclease family protein [Cytobacillus gottheilii]